MQIGKILGALAILGIGLWVAGEYRKSKKRMKSMTLKK